MRCPHLALFGTADMAVPVAPSISAFAAAACERGDFGLTVEVFAGANHRIRVGEDLAPGYLTTLTDWLSAASERGVRRS